MKSPKEIPVDQAFSKKKHFTKSKKELEEIKQKNEGEREYIAYIGGKIRSKKI